MSITTVTPTSELLQAGNKPNEFASATAETKQQLQRAIDAIKRKDEEHTIAMQEAKSEAKELRDQVAALAKMIDKLSGKVKRKKRVPQRRLSVSPPPLSKDDESSDEEKQLTPSRLRKKNAKHKCNLDTARRRAKKPLERTKNTTLIPSGILFGPRRIGIILSEPGQRFGRQIPKKPWQMRSRSSRRSTTASRPMKNRMNWGFGISSGNLWRLLKVTKTIFQYLIHSIAANP